jgi:hypothetical protein
MYGSRIIGWLKHGDPHNFMRKHLLTVGKTEKLKQIISAESKKNLEGFFSDMPC